MMYCPGSSRSGKMFGTRVTSNVLFRIFPLISRPVHQMTPHHNAESPIEGTMYDLIPDCFSEKGELMLGEKKAAKSRNQHTRK
jgi:hypothetical protein